MDSNSPPKILPSPVSWQKISISYLSYLYQHPDPWEDWLAKGVVAPDLVHTPKRRQHHATTWMSVATNKNVIVHLPTRTIAPFRMASSYFTISFSFKHAISLGEHRRLFQVQWSTCFSTLFWIFFLMAGRQQGNLASLETWNQYANVMAKPAHMVTKTMVKWNHLPQKIGGKETTSLKPPQISCTFAAELGNVLATNVSRI